MYPFGYGPVFGPRFGRLIVDSDFQGLQEPLILVTELDGSGGFEDFLCFGCGDFRLFPFGTAIKPNSSFKYHEDVETRSADFSDGLRDAIGLGQRLIDRVSQLLHQDFQVIVHVVPAFPGPACAHLPFVRCTSVAKSSNFRQEGLHLTSGGSAKVYCDHSIDLNPRFSTEKIDAAYKEAFSKLLIDTFSRIVNAAEEKKAELVT